MIIKNKYLFWIISLVILILMSYFVYKENIFSSKTQQIICECSNHNWNYWPKWEKCFEQMEQNIWSRWYYWELKYEKKVYYYLLKCK